MSITTSSHLRQLEAESIYLFREVVAECDHPVMLYSIGKDSSVLLHLARKAFYPSKLPFPLLHVDTTWKFSEMIEFRGKIVADYDLALIVYTNQSGLEQGVSPITHGSSLHTDIMKTEALKQALDKFGFDAALCCHFARRLIDGIQRISVQSYGIYSILEFEKVKALGRSRCPIGPSLTSGNIFSKKRFRLSPSILQKNVQSLSEMECW
jgi:3'-phosphoadenosine 5'-phosphosulfate sulfotransferase (PAPS reductase)/FAD synthetase